MPYIYVIKTKKSRKKNCNFTWKTEYFVKIILTVKNLLCIKLSHIYIATLVLVLRGTVFEEDLRNCGVLESYCFIKFQTSGFSNVEL